MTGARLTAALECANDAGGRCALWPSGDAHACYGVSHDTATSCAFAAGSVSAARAALTGTGATPQSEGLVRVRRQVCLRTPAPVPSGSLPANYPYAGRRFSAASRRRSTRSPTGRPSGSRASPSKAGVPPMARATAQAAKSGTRPSQVTDGLPARDSWTGSDPPQGGGRACENTLGPAPVPGPRAGGSSPPRPCCPVRHRRPGGDERNSKRPHGIGESGVCASSGVHCVHRPPTSHARSSTAQLPLTHVDVPSHAALVSDPG